MKTTILISAIALSGLLFNNKADAQVRIHFGINLAPRTVYVPARVVVSQPPVEYAQPVNYDGDEDYYYLPDVDAYYSTTEQCYYYSDGDRWISAAYLPGAYRDYDWRSARRYEIRASRPFMHNDYYRSRYNGVAFNGRWNDRNDFHREYADRHFDNHDQYRRDDRRFDNDRRNQNDNRGYQQNHGREQERYSQNMPQRNNGGNYGHRTNRF